MSDKNTLDIEEYEELLRLNYDEIYEINPACCTYKVIYNNDSKFLSFPTIGKIDKNFFNSAKELIHNGDWEVFLKGFNFDYLRRIISSNGKIPAVEYRRRKIDGDYCWTSQSIYLKRSIINEKYLYMIKDIHHKKKHVEEGCINENIIALQEQLKHQENYDALTNTYSKNKFYRETRKLLLKHSHQQFVMLRFDIARFKVINEFFGKEEGDELLKYIAENIRLILNNFDRCTFSRLEADIFCMCFPYSKLDVQKTVAYIERILRDYKLNFKIIPSFGAYIIENNEIPVDLICDRANLALKTVKGNYIRHFAFYDDTFRSALMKEQEIINCMSVALNQEQFEIYLQPKCDIQTGKTVGAEALVRWIHPSKGIIPPDDFIPIFERNGFIMKLDAYVWERVCKLIRRWIDEKKEVIPVSVNISRINLYNPRLCDILIGLVEKYEIPVKLLELEITESAYIENQQALVTVMARLQKYGFKIMMDDFGSGYSSLNTLKDIPVDVLKIDLKFLTGDNVAGRGGIILSSVVRMAKWLNLSIIAEGIETKEQASFLQSIGCIVGQGYYFKKPSPVNEFENYVEGYALDSVQEEKIIMSKNFNIDDFWDPKSNTSLFFNTMFSAFGIYEYNKGNIEAIRLNDQYFKMMGITREEFFYDTKAIMDIIHMDDRDKLHKLILNAISSKDVSEGTYRRLLKNGEFIWIHSRIKYLTGSGDRHLIYVVMNDLTNEVKEIELKESVLRFLPGGIFSIKAEKGYPLLYANEEFYKILGYTQEQLYNELENMTIKLIHPDDFHNVIYKLNEAISNKKREVCYITRIICRDGTIKNLFCGNGFSYYKNEINLNAVIFDISNFNNFSNAIIFDDTFEMDYINQMD